MTAGRESFVLPGLLLGLAPIVVTSWFGIGPSWGLSRVMREFGESGRACLNKASDLDKADALWSLDANERFRIREMLQEIRGRNIEFRQARRGDSRSIGDLRIEVLNRHTGGEACILVYSTYDLSISLGNLTSGQEYTVEVNDQTLKFVAQ